MNKAVIGGIAGLAIVGGFIGYKVLSLRADAAKWSGPMKEIAEESITHENNVTKDRFVSIIDAPIDKVQKVMWDVENLQNMVPNFKLSKLIEAKGNTKLLEINIQVLTLPTLAYTMEFTLHPEAHRVTFKTIKSQAQDIEGEYQLEPSPDGAKTRLTYMTTAKDKVAVPFPQSVLDSAGRETFVNTVRGLQKVVKQG
jgi:uncharacterized membrane protein